jgi:hypothetical protein
MSNHYQTYIQVIASVNKFSKEIYGFKILLFYRQKF